MILELSRAHFPVTVLGPGRRAGIWFQGCGIRCRGCVSRDTWESDASKAIQVQTLVEWVESLGGDVDGITITGGEPFDQPEALVELLAALRGMRRSAPFDLLAYSGYPFDLLQREHRQVLALLDVVVTEPFDGTQPSEHPWMGSGNQRLVPLTPLGHKLYDAQPVRADRIQVAVDDARIWYIGIPRRGDMQRLQRLAASRGLVQSDVSWRA